MKVNVAHKAMTQQLGKVPFNLPFIMAGDKDDPNPEIYHVCNGSQRKVHVHPGDGHAVVWSWHEKRPCMLPLNLEVIPVHIESVSISFIRT